MTHCGILPSRKTEFRNSFLATICLSRGLDAVPPVTAALTSGIEPILNPVLAAIICGETIGPSPWQGAFLVVCSVLGYSLSQIKQPSVPG